MRPFRLGLVCRSTDEVERRLARTVGEMLGGLPLEQESALRLTEYEGLTQKDLAGCHFELDRRRKVVNYYDKGPRS